MILLKGNKRHPLHIRSSQHASTAAQKHLWWISRRNGNSRRMGSTISPGTSSSVCSCNVHSCLLEEFHLICFLWNRYKVATFKVKRKGEHFLSHFVVRKSTEICLRLTTFFHVSSLSLVLAYVAFLLSPSGLRKDIKWDSCLLSSFILNVEMNV